MKPLIEGVRFPQAASNDDWVKILGKPRQSPMFYRHQNGTEYASLHGGLAWPVLARVPVVRLWLASTATSHRLSWSWKHRSANTLANCSAPVLT